MYKILLLKDTDFQTEWMKKNEKKYFQNPFFNSFNIFYVVRATFALESLGNYLAFFVMNGKKPVAKKDI